MAEQNFGGWWRLWTVISVLWVIVGNAWLIRIADYTVSVDLFFAASIVTIIPPALLLLCGYTVRWIFRGFVK